MMPGSYLGLDHREKTMDLDAVVDVARGTSKKRPGWTALVIYVPDKDAFVELRDSPPDVQGNSHDEAEEVTLDYLAKAYGIERSSVDSLRASPHTWRLVQSNN